jgi:hypothetical protein
MGNPIRRMDTSVKDGWRESNRPLGVRAPASRPVGKVGKVAWFWDYLPLPKLTSPNTEREFGTYPTSPTSTTQG